MRADISRLAARAARWAGLAALVPGALAYDYVVWRVSLYAWGMGIHFYASSVFTADALWYIIHCFFLGIAVFLGPRFAGLSLPRFAGTRKLVLTYVAFLAVVGAAAAVNYRLQFFTNPFAGRGPLFFTLGPLAWELMWPGLAFGFGAALLGPDRERRWGRVFGGVLALGGVAWYIPILNWLSTLDAAGFLILTSAINVFSISFRRRTGSIWPGLAAHLLIKFFLTW